MSNPKALAALVVQLADGKAADQAQTQKCQNAIARRAELQADLTIDIDKAAEADAKAKKIIDEHEFKAGAIQRRNEAVTEEIRQGIKEGLNDHARAEKQALAARKAEANRIIASDEFQEFIKQLRGLYALGDYWDWDRLIEQVIPQSGDRKESEAIARELWDWTETPELPQEIRDAKIAIDFDNEDLPTFS